MISAKEMRCRDGIRKAAPKVDDQHGGRRTDGYDRAKSDQEEEPEWKRTRENKNKNKNGGEADENRIIRAFIWTLLFFAPLDLALLPYTSPSFTTCYYYNYYCCYHYYCHKWRATLLLLLLPTLDTFLWDGCMRHDINQPRGTSGRIQFASLDLIF